MARTAAVNAGMCVVVVNRAALPGEVLGLCCDIEKSSTVNLVLVTCLGERANVGEEGLPFLCGQPPA